MVMENKIDYSDKSLMPGGIKCPRCQNKIVADIYNLLNGSPVICGNCELTLNIDMKQSESTIRALGDFTRINPKFGKSFPRQPPPTPSTHKVSANVFMQKHPNIKLIWKEESRLMKFINSIMHFGNSKHPFMLKYATTIGNNIYMPKAWWDPASEEQKIILLRHELVHVKQMAKYSVPLFFFLYIFVPFPIGLGYFRAKFEKEGYAETLRARYEYWGVDSITSDDYRTWVISQFTGGAYGWMWPFKKSANTWYDSVISKIIKT